MDYPFIPIHPGEILKEELEARRSSSLKSRFQSIRKACSAAALL